MPGRTKMQDKYYNFYADQLAKKSKTPFQQLKQFYIYYLLENQPCTPEALHEAAEAAGLDLTDWDAVQDDLELMMDKDGLWALPEKEPTAAITQEGRLEPAEDSFTLTPEEKRQFGIKDTEQVCWIRDPRYWGKLVPGDSVREHLRHNPGGRVVMQNGEYVSNGIDLILATVPKVYVDARLRDQAARDADLQRQIDGEKMADDDFDPSDRRANAERKARNSAEHIRLGMIGPQSPSSGLPYEDYVKWRGLTEADIEAEERTFSLPGHYGRELDEEEAQAVIASQRKGRTAEQPRDTGGRFYSLPATVRPRNLMKR